MSKTRHFTYLTMLSALAVVVNLVEGAFIPPLQFGIRFGFANILALMAIALFGIKEMFIVNAMRVTIGNLLKGMIFGSPFWISFGGVLLSSVVLMLAYKGKSSFLFMSISSALAHSIGQLSVVMFFYAQVNILALLPVLLISSIGTGLLTGYLSKECLRRIG